MYLAHRPTSNACGNLLRKMAFNKAYRTNKPSRIRLQVRSPSPSILQRALQTCDWFK